jgi:hypothetical protein
MVRAREIVISARVDREEDGTEWGARDAFFLAGRVCVKENYRCFFFLFPVEQMKIMQAYMHGPTWQQDTRWVSVSDRAQGGCPSDPPPPPALGSAQITTA